MYGMSNLEDEDHMTMMRTQYHFQRNRLVTFDSIEEMWALISLAPHVVTDRYHPGIATTILGVKLTLTNYPNERVVHETQELQRELGALSKLMNLHQINLINGG